MTKDELVTKLAESTSITKKKADEILSALADSISESLRKGEKNVLPGIGSFSRVDRKTRTGRNPRTGKEDGKILRIGAPGHGAQQHGKGEDRLGHESCQRIYAAMGRRLANENSERPTPPSLLHFKGEVPRWQQER